MEVITTAPLVSDPPNPWTGNVDPRLDWTAGRPGKPWFDWGTVDSTWIRDVPNDGLFVTMKNNYAKESAGYLFINRNRILGCS